MGKMSIFKPPKAQTCSRTLFVLIFAAGTTLWGHLIGRTTSLLSVILCVMALPAENSQNYQTGSQHPCHPQRPQCRNLRENCQHVVILRDRRRGQNKLMAQARERRGHLRDTQVFSGTPPSAECLLLTEEPVLSYFNLPKEL